VTTSDRQNAFVRAALSTSDGEVASLQRQRDELEAVPVDVRSRQDGNRLAYLDWTLDRVAKGRAILGEKALARARADEELRKTLAAFHAASSSLL